MGDIMKQKSVRILAILFVSLCVLSSGVLSASAAVEEPEFPVYVAVTQISPRLVVELGTAYCSDYIIIKSGYSVSATWYLQYYQSGKWENLATWTDTGTKSLPFSKKRAVVSGNTYRLKTALKVYNTQGKLVESPTKYSSMAAY